MTTAEFQAEFLGNAVMPTASPADALMDEYVQKRSATVQQARELGVGPDGIAEVTHKMAAAFMRRWMMLRYAVVDLSFTQRLWWITAERVGRDGAKVVSGSDVRPDTPEDGVMRVVGSVPRFFTETAEAKAFAFQRGNDRIMDGHDTHAVGELANGTRSGVRCPSLTVRVSAKVPDGIGDRHRKLVQQAMGHAYGAKALLYGRGVDISAELAPLDSRRHYSPDGWSAQVKVIWAPLADVLSVTASPPRPVGDPAVVLEAGGNAYLLDFYDTPDERPIEHLIREFSEGKLPERS